MIKRDSGDYDKAEFFKTLKDLQKYQVGDIHFCIQKNKIFECVICRVDLYYYNNYITHNSHKQLFLEYSITVLLNGSSTDSVKVKPKDLFNTREEAAEQFLKDNDVPSELLKVLKVTKPKTTVADLITQLSNINPEIDLDGYYWRIVKDIQAIYLDSIVVEAGTTSGYWDCECDTQYIHPAYQYYCPICKAERNTSPDSRVSEIKLENMFK